MPSSKSPMFLGRDFNHGIEFFSSLRSWNVYLKKKYPKALVAVQGGVRRAYVGKAKVAVFGRMPGHGFVAMATAISYLGRKRRLNPREDN